jgi:hypothetical protein
MGLGKSLNLVSPHFTKKYFKRNNMMKYINIYILLISFVVGLIFVYFMTPEMRNIYVYPTPENVEILQYKDATDTCFKYKQKEVKCPSNPKEITKPKPQN